MLLYQFVSATNGATIDILDDNAVAKPEGFSQKLKFLPIVQAWLPLKLNLNRPLPAYGKYG